jgi:hypothetical protein
MAVGKPASKCSASLIDLNQNGKRVAAMIDVQLLRQTCIQGKHATSTAELNHRGSQAASMADMQIMWWMYNQLASRVNEQTEWQTCSQHGR